LWITAWQRYEFAPFIIETYKKKGFALDTRSHPKPSASNREDAAESTSIVLHAVLGIDKPHASNHTSNRRPYTLFYTGNRIESYAVQMYDGVLFAE